MLLRIAKPAEKELKSIVKVGGYVIASSAVAVGVAAAAHNAKLVDLMPAINLIAVAISKFVKKEEGAAIAQLPQNEQAAAAELAAKVEAGAQSQVEHYIPYQNPQAPAN